MLILADDLGYGDVRALNPKSTIPTPNLDRLAKEGMTFTDAHSPSAVCTPTRYGLLTGRYCWRTKLTRGVLGGYSPPLIARERPTIATMLKKHGYYSAAIGKWHLGMDLPMLKKGGGKGRGAKGWAGDPGVDFTGRIADGPTARGFDEYLGVTASLDMPPYVMVENDRFASQPTLKQPAVKFPDFVRAGPRSKDFVIDEVLDRLTKRVVDAIGQRAQAKQPFFIYFPLTAPHKPTTPHKRFRGKTKLGPYGDFIVQVDWSVGQVLAALDEHGLNDNTLVIFSSDNGSYMFRYDDPNREDHVDNARIQGYRADRHRSNGPLRGTKADVWEAGHRVPFFARLPGKIKAGSQSAEPICLTDIYATCAEIIGAEPGQNAAEDSLSLWPLLTDQANARRGAPVIHHSAAGMFAIRDGKWKLVLGNGSGGRQAPRGKPFARPFHLFDLSQDLGETTNLIEKHPDVAAELLKKFEAVRKNGRSRP